MLIILSIPVIPFILLICPLTSPLVTSSLCSVFKSLFLCLFCVFIHFFSFVSWIPHMNEIMLYLIFSFSSWTSFRFLCLRYNLASPLTTSSNSFLVINTCFFWTVGLEVGPFLFPVTSSDLYSITFLWERLLLQVSCHSDIALKVFRICVDNSFALSFQFLDLCLYWFSSPYIWHSKPCNLAYLQIHSLQYLSV